VTGYSLLPALQWLITFSRNARNDIRFHNVKKGLSAELEQPI